MKKYSELLRDGRWQVRKTEIMTRVNFSCQRCGKSALEGTILNVHHIKYKKGAMPWEYGDEDLITLCEECHHHTHSKEKSMGGNGIKVGDFISFSHSDFDDYGIVIQSPNNDVGLAIFADSGSGSHTMWFGDIVGERVANRYDYEQTNELNDFFAYVADYILKVVKGLPIERYTFFCLNDFPIEKVKKRAEEFTRNNFAEMAKNNAELNKYWEL